MPLLTEVRMVPEAAPESVVSHWSTLIENFQASPQAFYQAVEEGLKRRQVPETTNSRVTYKQAGFLSSNREYLHIVRDRLLFDICAAPFGTGFFVSWWLAEARLTLNPIVKVLIVIGFFVFVGTLVTSAGVVTGLILSFLIVAAGLAIANSLANESGFNDDIVCALPLVGGLYRRLFKPTTYFSMDTAAMYQKAVHNAVLEVLETMTNEKGIRALTETERKPVMREFYRKVA